MKKIGVRQLKKIDGLVDYFIENQPQLETLLKTLLAILPGTKKLQSLIHSYKFRIKDAAHLKDKLQRKAIKAMVEGTEFDITNENLFSKVTDLVGFRLIHLNTRQIEEINLELKAILDTENWQIIEGPAARTWDDESREYFRAIGIEIHDSPNPNMYTSVHYIVKPNSKTNLTCEIQVRTLMEEVWGEVDHSINYPHKTDSLSCQEQIKTLARVTSGCSRLVDSIFASHAEFTDKNTTSKSKPSKKASK